MMLLFVDEFSTISFCQFSRHPFSEDLREIEHILIAREIESSSSSGNETEVSLVIAKLRASRFIYLINRLTRLLRTVSLKARLGHS